MLRVKGVSLAAVMAGVVVLGAAALAVNPAVAAKGGNGHGVGSGNGSTIVLDQAVPHFGDKVTFTVSTDRTDRPWVNAKCYQGGELVYEQWHGLYEDYRFEPVFTLGPTPRWTGGGAECVAYLAELLNGRTRVLASTQFSVAP